MSGGREGLLIPEDLREPLQDEATALSIAVADPQRRRALADLREALPGGEVSGELKQTLEDLLVLVLESGRARRLHGPLLEASFATLYRATPRGAEAARAVAELNRALESLRGRSITRITFEAKGPGSYALRLETDRCTATVVIERGGLTLKEVGVEL